MTGPRPVDVVRLGLGLALLARPEAPLRLAEDGAADLERTAVRVLGARYVAQAMVGLVSSRSRWVRRGDVAVEVVHAASMLGLAAASPRHRRPALVSAVVALAFSAVDLRDPAS